MDEESTSSSVLVLEECTSSPVAVVEDSTSSLVEESKTLPHKSVKQSDESQVRVNGSYFGH